MNAYNEPKDRVADFVRKGKLRQRVLLNGGQTATELFGVRAMPSSFLIDRGGSIVERIVGFSDPEGKERKVVELLKRQS